MPPTNRTAAGPTHHPRRPRRRRAQVTCEAGCECSPTELDGHHSDRVSLTNLHLFTVSQAENCSIAVTVLEETASSTSGHKVKVSALVVAERAGEGEQLKNKAAVDMVGAAVALAPDGMWRLESFHGQPAE